MTIIRKEADNRGPAARAGRIAFVVLALALAGARCGGSKPKETADAPPPEKNGDPVHGTVNKPGATAAGDPTATGTAIPVAAGSKEYPVATVGELVASADRVGTRVHVTGRCLGYSATGGGGAPPLTKSDWLLGADGATIYVSGEVPPGCSGTTAGIEPVTILALVAQDTLPGLADKPGVSRRYLVRVGP